MVKENVDRLQTKIDVVSKLVNELKEENQRLKDRNKHLEDKLAEDKETSNELNMEDNSVVALKEDYDLLQRENYEMKQDRDSIETGIEEILSQISDLL